MGFIDSLKKICSEGKLIAIQQDKHKRCGHCDFYSGETRICQKHQKQIQNAFGAGGEYCADYSDLKETMLKGIKKSL